MLQLLKNLLNLIQIPITAHDELQLKLRRGVDELLDHADVDALPLVHLREAAAFTLVRCRVRQLWRQAREVHLDLRARLSRLA